MNRRQSRAAVIAAPAAGTMVGAACTGSAGGSASPSGPASSATGLAAVTPAGTKPVSSVVWATNHDVISLDPIFSARYTEYTADSLLRESPLRQAPDGSLQRGLATSRIRHPPRWCSRPCPGGGRDDGTGRGSDGPKDQ